MSAQAAWQRQRVAADCSHHILQPRLAGGICRVRFWRGFVHMLVGRHVGSARNDDPDRVVGPFGREILGEQVAQPSGLHADNSVGGRIEIGVLAENIHGDREAFEPFGFAGLFPFDEIANELARALRPSKGLAGEQSLESFAHCGGGRRILLQASDLSIRAGTDHIGSVPAHKEAWRTG
jgi:hypothetical protein